ncbi:hypothetical protein B0J13DRAFT_520618 [Dactylonectria estremocensis]|uniref:TRP C-terminal domain-containing protein n=1 Tax=Dactylonectria estremocensis TaxID=1079267 RepID=A0A9P9FAX9_9HYPO|nr:hypothetical protein B0J13DRAFT_520618 [Dactylonectria estremocensis]
MAIFSFPFDRNPLSLSSFLCILSLILSFARPNLAAYVQYQDCFPVLAASGQHVLSQRRLVPEGLRAFLQNDGDNSRLELRIQNSFPAPSSCEQILRQNVTAGVTLLELGGSNHYVGDIVNTSCYPSPWAKKGDKELKSELKILFQVDRPHPLAAYKLNVDLLDADADHLPVGCVNAFLTPGIGAAAYDACLWGPLAVFVLVVLAAGWREMANAGRVDDEDEDDGNSQASGRLHLTRIADCLSYIQFIFFSGALSLRYPGFVQPVVGPSSWSTLMLPRGLIIQQSVYSGTDDGIYEINGTFGGTPGLELMTQVTGAPVTMHTWTNIVSLAFVILFFLFCIIQVGLMLRWTRDWFRQASSWTLQRSATDRHKATAWIVLRVFLSYFLMPLVAWTAYQIEGVRTLPGYYTVIASVAICIVLVACWWGLSQRGPQNMGYLIIDGSQEEQIGDPTLGKQDLHTLATFVLLFVRGATIGALQGFGTAQLLVLLVCEASQLILMGWAGSVTILSSRASMVSCAKLGVLLACIGLIPDVASYEASSAIGYGILIFHALILVVFFLVPTVCDIAGLAVAAFQNKMVAEPDQDEERPQIYGLRQLHRRPNTRNNLSIHATNRFDQSSSASGDSDTPAFRSPRGSSQTSGQSSTQVLRTHFRSPRSETSFANLIEKNQQSRISGVSSSEESQSSGQSTTESVSLELPIPRTSTPGVDYSFREADLYYIRPRQVSFRQNGPGSNATPVGFMQKVKFWVRGS